MLSYLFHKVLIAPTASYLSCNPLLPTLGVNCCSLARPWHHPSFLPFPESLSPFCLPGQVRIFDKRCILYVHLSLTCSLHRLKLGSWMLCLPYDDRRKFNRIFLLLHYESKIFYFLYEQKHCLGKLKQSTTQKTNLRVNITHMCTHTLPTSPKTIK